MAINLLQDKGTPLHRQDFTWKDLVQKPIRPAPAGMEQICLNEASAQ